jgi:hypothetical protein
MPELVGLLPTVALSRLLVLLPLLPLIASLAAAIGWKARGARPASDPRETQGRTPAATGSGLVAMAHLAPWAASLGLAAWGAHELGEQHGGFRLLLSPSWEALHLGSLGLTLGFALDPLSMPVLVLVQALAALAIGWAALRAAPAAQGRDGLLAALQATGASATVVVIADGFPTLLIGLGLVAAAAAAVGLALVREHGAAGAPEAERSIVLGLGARLAGVALATASSGLLFWGLSGSWLPEGYVPDLRPAVAVMGEGGQAAAALRDRDHDDDDDDDRARAPVPGGNPAPPEQDRASHGQSHAEAVAKLGAKGGLTMTAMPGARVYLDGSSTPVGRSPFVRLPVPAGVHAVRVSPGAGADDVEVPTFRVEEGHEVTLVAATGALTFREAATLLGAQQAGAPFSVRSRLGSASAAAPAPTTTPAVVGAPPVSPAGPTAGPAVGPPVGGLVGGTGLWVLLGFLAAAAAGALPAGSIRSPGAALGLALLPAVSSGYAALRVAATLGSEPSPWALAAAALLTASGGGWALAMRPGVGTPGRAARAVSLAFAAQIGLATAAAASGAVEAGALHLLTTSLGAALALWSLEALWQAGGQAGGQTAAHASDRGASLAGSGERTPRALLGLKIGAATLSLLPPLGGAFSLLEALRGVGASGVPMAVLAPLALSLAAGAAAGAFSLAVIVREASGPAKKAQGQAAVPAGVPLWPAAALAIGCLVVGPLGAAALFDAPLAEWMESARLPRPPGAQGTLLPFLLAAGAVVLSAAAWLRAGSGSRQAPAGQEGGDGGPEQPVGARQAAGAAGLWLVRIGGLVASIDLAIEAAFEAPGRLAGRAPAPRSSDGGAS